jgi:hypothetical protein
MADVPRIDVEEARRRVNGRGALLVCAYEDDAKCRQIALQGATPLSDLERRAAALSKDQELIFYCA